jgi:hypothetical protein
VPSRRPPNVGTIVGSYPSFEDENCSVSKF